MPSSDRVVIELAAMAGDRWGDPDSRLKRALKNLGRAYGLRVVSLRRPVAELSPVVDVDPAPPAPAVALTWGEDGDAA